MNSRLGAAGLAAVVWVALAGCGAESGPDAEAGDAAGSVSATPGVTGSASGAPEGGGEKLASGELQERWWTWAASEPEGTNPVADPDGRSCGRNQPRDVWFLAGTFGGEVERTCEVPAGRPIAAPLVNLFGQRQDCAAFVRGARGTAVLDGKAVEPEVHGGAPIVVIGARGNPITGEEGRFGGVVGCGLWVRLPPLAPGRHELEIRGRSGDFTVGVDYVLTVTAAAA
ncbi:signal protein [Streptomyces sp. NPDC003327]